MKIINPNIMSIKELLPYRIKSFIFAIRCIKANIKLYEQTGNIYYKNQLTWSYKYLLDLIKNRKRIF